MLMDAPIYKLSVWFYGWENSLDINRGRLTMVNQGGRPLSGLLVTFYDMQGVKEPPKPKLLHRPRAIMCESSS